MSSDQDIDKAMEVGSIVIKGLPNIKDLRSIAQEMHEQAVRLWMDVKGAEESREYRDVKKWGFTSEQLEVINNYKMSLLSEIIMFKQECNCMGVEGSRGDTYSILPDGISHHTWCKKAIEYTGLYDEVMERFK